MKQSSNSSEGKFSYSCITLKRLSHFLFLYHLEVFIKINYECPYCFTLTVHQIHEIKSISYITSVDIDFPIPVSHKSVHQKYRDLNEKSLSRWVEPFILGVFHNDWHIITVHGKECLVLSSGCANTNTTKWEQLE